MRRQPNVRLFLWLAGVLLGGGLAVCFVHAFQVQRNAGTLLNRAESALRDGDVAQALTYFSHYLAYEPTDVKALARYGLTLQKHGNTGAMRIQAMLTLEDVLRREPGRTDVRFHLIQCLISLGNDRLGEALDHLHLLLPSWPDKGELEHLIGWCHEAREEAVLAVEWFRRSVADDPARIPTYALLADVLGDQLDQPEEARKVMDAMIAANKQNARAYLVRARFRKRHGALTPGEEDVKRALRLAPKDEEALLTAAHWAEAAGNLEDAGKLCHEAELAQPASEAVYQNRAALELRRGRPAEAIACLRRGIDAIPQAIDLLVALADLLLENGNKQEARGIAERLANEHSATFLQQYLTARLAIAEHRWAEAADLLEKAAEDMPPASPWGSRVQALLGACYEEKGDMDRALTAFEHAVRLAPEWSASRLALGTALLAAGRCEDALTEFRIVQQTPSPPDSLWPLLARALIQHNQRQRPQDREWLPVQDALAKLAKVNPESVDRPLLEAQLLVASGKTAEARALLEKCRDQRPREPAFWTALAALAGQQKEWDEAVRILDDAGNKLGDRIELRLERLALWSARGGAQAKAALTSIGSDLERFGPAEQLRVLRSMADAWYRLGDLMSAGTVWRQIADREPRDLPSRLGLFELALEQDQVREARRLARAISALDGDAGALSAYTRAALLLSEGPPGDARNLEEADRLLAEAGRSRRAWTRVPLLRAKIAEVQGDIDRAIEFYLAALRLGESQPGFVQRLTRLLAGRRRYFEAEQVLRRAEERGTLGNDGARLGAEIALALRDSPRALRLAAAAVTPGTRDYRDLLWLGRIYYLAGKNARAEQTLRHALEVAGHAPDTWVALVRHLTRTGQRDRCAQVLADMAQRLPIDRYPLARARCEEAMGRLDRADAELAELIRREPGNFAVLCEAADFYQRADQPQKAEPLLRQLLDPRLAAPGEITGWARRMLALNLAQSGTASAHQEAGGLLAENSRVFGPSVADDRVRAVLLGANPGTRRKALALFEATLPRRPLSPDEQLALVQLLDAAGEPAKARDWLQDLLVTHPDTPRYLAYFGRRLVEREHTVEALPFLRRLEELEPGSPRVRDLRARLGHL